MLACGLYCLANGHTQLYRVVKVHIGALPTTDFHQTNTCVHLSSILANQGNMFATGSACCIH
jgi:hypothetical protein